MIKSVKPIMMEEDHGLLTPGCVVEMSTNISEQSKKLFIAWYADFPVILISNTTPQNLYKGGKT